MEAMVGFTIIVCILALLLHWFIARKFENIANMKGHKGYLGWCFFLGLIGWLMVVALPDRGQQRRRSNRTVRTDEAYYDDAGDENLPEL